MARPAADPTVLPDLSLLDRRLRPISDAYDARLQAAKKELARLDRIGGHLANGRTVTFLGAVALALLAAFERLGVEGYVGAVLLLLGYAALAQRHQRVLRAEDRERARIDLNVRGLCRLAGTWRAFSETGERFLVEGHLYAADLNVFGHASAFQLLNEAATLSGEARLARYLAEAAPPEEIAARQEAVRELAPKLDLRQSIGAEGRLLSAQKANPDGFVAWAESDTGLSRIRWAYPLAHVLPVLTAVLYAAGQAGALPRQSFWAGLFLSLAVLLATRKTLKAAYDRLAKQQGFTRYEALIEQVERATFNAPRLLHLRRQIAPDDAQRASGLLAQLGRLLGFAELRESGQLHALINLLTLWDVHWMFRLERWRRVQGPRVRTWFDALADLEALGSLASLAHDRPQFTFPQVVPGAPKLTARALGHPLLDRAVPNDVQLAEGRTALLVTGSNMSGKTTLVRALGLNAVLAYAGAPVCAEQLVLSPLRVVTSMRVQDSLERGLSYFYAEVQRLKQVLDAARDAGGKALFLLDEILLGTNTRERQIASRHVLRLLLQTGAIGAVTTHDLSLAELAQENGITVRPVHFRDQLQDGQMRFDYHLREGVVDTTNALRVLKLAGFEIEA